MSEGAAGAAPDVRPTRRYDATKRRAAARERRDRIADAAAEMFAADGWGGTTIARVAAAAGVSPELVTATFGTKGGLAMAALQRVGFGEDHDLPAAFAALGLEALDPADRLEVCVDFAVRSVQPMAPLIPVLQVATGLDPAALEAVERGNERHLATCRTLAKAFARRPSARMVDEIYLLTKAEAFVVLTEERGWSVAAYRSWLRDNLAGVLGIER